MRLLLDTNILVDELHEREPFRALAHRLLLLGKLGEFELWIAPSQIGDLAYLLTRGGKKSLAETARTQLRQLRTFVHVCPMGESEVDAALDCAWDDLEDALVYQAARSICADALITRNQQDFPATTIPVYSCEEFFRHLEESQGIAYAEFEISPDGSATMSLAG